MFCKMASPTRRWSQLILLIFLNSHLVFGNLFNSGVLDDVELCNSACDKTYPLHTYPKAQHGESCKRGCRFFSIADFINDQGDMNSTKKACESSCGEAYAAESEDKFACTTGCSNQFPVSAKKRKQVRTFMMENSDDQTLHLLSPFMYVQRIYGSVMDRMTNYVSVSLSYYVQQDDGKVVVVQSGPKFVSSNSELAVDSSDKDRNTIRFGPMTSLFRHKIDNTFDLDDVLNVRDGNSLPEITELSSRNEETLKQREEMMGGGGMDWLGCVSRKSGLPRWFLGMTIFLSSFAMIWLCFATTATAPEHRIHKVSYFGDLDYLRTSDPHEKVKIQPCPEYEAVAPPLPVKVHIEKL